MSQGAVIQNTGTLQASRNVSKSYSSGTRGHSPNLDTVMMIEATILENKEFDSKTQFWKALPKAVQYPTFKKAIDYLERRKIIAYDDNAVIWIFANTPELQKLDDQSTVLR